MICFIRRHLLLVSFVSALLVSGPATSAQQPDLDDLAKRLCQQIARARINSVVVADFTTKDGAASREGHFLAGELSQGLGTHMRNLVVADRAQLSEAMSHNQILPKDLAAPDALGRLGTSLQVGAVITATVEASPAQYLVEATLRNATDGTVLDSSQQLVKRPAIADGMVFLSSQASPQELAVAGENGVGIPTCIHCPTPVYTDKARVDRRQGNVVLVAIVTADGRVSKTIVTGNPGGGLADQATRIMSKWKLKPATDRQGKPLDVLVPIEVTFRLY